MTAQGLSGSPPHSRWRSPSLSGIDSFWREPALEPWWSWWHAVELAVVFAVGACVMNFLYAQATAVGGVPGNDSWYHVKMAELLPQLAATREFPWLRFAYFTDTSDEFVSHHFGFHVLLVPFIQLGKQAGGDALTGARWAVCTFFGATLAVFHLVLMTQRVRARWLWLCLYLLMPSDFFFRHGLVRAIAPSLMFMLLMMALMFRRRYAWAGVALAAYIQVYLGAVLYGPLVVIGYAVAGLVGPRGERVSWRLGLWTLLGWAVGVRLYPYSDHVYEFLRLQVFGSGLAPDISVGREWTPYENVWALARASSWTAVPLLIAAALRLRLGPRLNARELGVLLISVAFAVLMLKSRRFVEYWPPFALLAAALLAAPPVNTALRGLADRLTGPDRQWLGWAAAAGLLVFGGGITAQVIADGRHLHLERICDNWPLWVALAAGCMLAPLGRCWRLGRGGTDSRPTRQAWPRKRGPCHPVRLLDGLAFLATGVVFAIAVAALQWAAFGRPDAAGRQLLVPWWCFAGLGAIYVVAGLVAGSARLPTATGPARPPVLLAAMCVLAGLTVVGQVLVRAGPQLVDLQRQLKPKFDLPDIRAAMAAVVDESAPGAVIFTDDWDIFPVYFFVNDHNHYVVGLDPKFTHQRDPVLWERYKKITRGQTPATYTYQDTYGGPPAIERKIDIRLEDIRDVFGAAYVIVDKDHGPLRRKLDGAGTFCERIHPPPDRATSTAPARGDSSPAYAVYRVLSRQERTDAEAARKKVSK